MNRFKNLIKNKIKIDNIFKDNIDIYFYDCEFHVSENGTKIDLISIGFIPLDDSKKGLYLINKDFIWDQSVNDWLHNNVKPSIDQYLSTKSLSHLSNKQLQDSDVYYLPFKQFKQKISNYIKPKDDKLVELWGYYCDFDHVCLSSCYGNMIDFPDYLPMWTNDLRQILNNFDIDKDKLLSQPVDQHDCLSDAYWNKTLYQKIKQKVLKQS